MAKAANTEDQEHHLASGWGERKTRENPATNPRQSFSKPCSAELHTERSRFWNAPHTKQEKDVCLIKPG
jgi:hypothetical protein